MFNAQPPEVRELLLSTAILEQVNAEAATELAGDDEAGRILRALAHANALSSRSGAGGIATTLIAARRRPAAQPSVCRVRPSSECADSVHPCRASSRPASATLKARSVARISAS